MKNQFEDRFTLVLECQMKAVTPLHVTQPGSSFGRNDDVSRLPRRLHGHKDSPCYFPGRTIQGALRHLASDMIYSKVNPDSTKVTVDQLYMLAQGYDTSDRVYRDTPDGAIAVKGGLRDVNPLISLFGRWGLSGNLKISDFLPDQSQGEVVSIRALGTRTNAFQRNPEMFEKLNEAGLEKVQQILSVDTQIQKEIAVKKKEIRSLESQMFGAENQDEAQEYRASIEQLRGEVEELEAGKAGGQNSIQRPLPGTEAFIEGTVLKGKMTLAVTNKIELGFLLHTLRAFSESPFLGSRRGDFGQVECDIQFKWREKGSLSSTVIGTVLASYDEFDMKDNGDYQLLQESYKAFDDVLSDPQKHGVNFGRFFFDEKA